MTEKELYLKKVSEIIKKRYFEFEIIKKKSEITESDKKTLADIVKDVEGINKQTKIIKNLYTSDLVKLTKLTNVFEEYNHLFSYDIKNNRYAKDDSTLTYNENVGSNLIINNFYNGNGFNRKTLGINDDVTNYSNDPIFSVTKQTGNKSYGGFIHQVGIKNEYKISFEFILNRFPSKTFQNSEQNLNTLQYTTRRTDLIKFLYKDNQNKNEKLNPNVIEFGAMAPNGNIFDYKYVKQRLESPKSITEEEIKKIKFSYLNYGNLMKASKLYLPSYKDKYSPFSIAASITCGNNYRISVFTDYKFNLGVSYFVTMIIRKNGEFDFGDEGEYEIIMDINGNNELLFPYVGKIWNRGSNKYKNDNTIPSQPGFKSKYLPKYIGKKDEEQTNLVNDHIKYELTYVPKERTIFNLKRLNLSTLEKIKTVPYIHNFLKIDSIYNKKLYSTNRGVNFRMIDIYNK